MRNKRGSVTARSSLGTPSVTSVGIGFWRVLLAFLLLSMVGLVYRIWFSDTSIDKLDELDSRLTQQKQENAEIAEQNRRLVIEIEALKNGTEEIETRAREDLGLVKADETFYLIVEE